MIVRCICCLIVRQYWAILWFNNFMTKFMMSWEVSCRGKLRHGQSITITSGANKPTTVAYAASQWKAPLIITLHFYPFHICVQISIDTIGARQFDNRPNTFDGIRYRWWTAMILQAIGRHIASDVLLLYRRCILLFLSRARHFIAIMVEIILKNEDSVFWLFILRRK